ncbi:MAG TPA: AMP-binding protein [Burkholderiaceae bacterium]|nr:AMP-binding protein [Burkholderiaceae bacterium]
MTRQRPMQIRSWAERTPSKTAVVYGDTRVSYGELETLANRFADLFRTLGLQRGEHIASLLRNRPEALAVAWAAYRTGLYLTPLPTTLAVREATYLLENSDARLLIADASLSDLASQLPALAAHPTSWFSLGGDIRSFERLEPLLAAASPAPCNVEPPGALMLYTSGTTGAPKGVWRPLAPPDFKGTPPFAADLLSLFDLAGPEVNYLSTAPLYHSAPLRFALAVTAGGGTVFLMEKFDATLALDLLERDGITHSQWVPTMFQRLLALPQARRAAFKASAASSTSPVFRPSPTTTIRPRPPPRRARKTGRRLATSATWTQRGTCISPIARTT